MVRTYTFKTQVNVLARRHLLKSGFWRTSWCPGQTKGHSSVQSPNFLVVESFLTQPVNARSRRKYAGKGPTGWSPALVGDPRDPYGGNTCSILLPWGWRVSSWRQVCGRRRIGKHSGTAAAVRRHRSWWWWSTRVVGRRLVLLPWPVVGLCCGR